MSADSLINLETVHLQKDSNEMHVKIKELLSNVQTLVVDNQSAYEEVTRIYRAAQTAKKAIDTKRKELTAPFRNEMARINDRAKQVLDPLDKITEIANIKAGSYQKLLESHRQKEEEKVRAAAALFDLEDFVECPVPEKIHRGDGAISVIKTKKEFRLIDISKVPIQYLRVDEEAIKKDIELGINAIQGLEIFEVTTTTLRMR